jgi:hypothetical protein
MGDKLFAVPWQALHLDTVNKRFVLDIDKDRLRTAPGFDKDAWPDMADAQWAQHIHSFYGTDSTRSGAPSMGPNVAMRGMVGGGTGVGSGVGAGMGSMGAGHAGSVDTGMGAGSSISGGSAGGRAGGSLDPRPGTAGDDKDLSKIRGSNLG